MYVCMYACMYKSIYVRVYVKSIFSENEVENTILSFKEDFEIVPRQLANNVAFICSHFYAFLYATIIKELNLDYNNTYTFININNNTKDHIIKEHKLYLFKRKIDLTNNMQDLPVISWITKMHKTIFL